MGLGQGHYFAGLNFNFVQVMSVFKIFKGKQSQITSFSSICCNAAHSTPARADGGIQSTHSFLPILQTRKLRLTDHRGAEAESKFAIHADITLKIWPAMGAERQGVGGADSDSGQERGTEQGAEEPAGAGGESRPARPVMCATLPMCRGGDDIWVSPGPLWVGFGPI